MQQGLRPITTEAKIIQIPGPIELTHAYIKEMEFTPSSTHVNTTFDVFLEADKDKRIVATCPKLQGAVAGGDTEKEALENITDAINAILEDINDEKEFNIVCYYIESAK